MSANKLEISIVKDSAKNDAELEGMTLEVAKAFTILVESLTKIVQASPNQEKLRICVEKGSVKVLIRGDGITEIRNNYLQVIRNQTSDRALVEPWRDLQKLIQNNGITYNSELLVDGQKTAFHHVLREAPPFRRKRKIKPALQAQIKFFQGRLYQLGGKRNDNIHLEIDSDTTIIIDCTEEQAANSTKYFKQTALISAWALPGDDKPTYLLCNSYFGDELPLFQRFENFVTDFESSESELDSLDKLHFECRKYLDQKDYKSFKRFLQLFNNENIDISILHSISMLTLPFENTPELKTVLCSINSIIDKKLLKLNRNPVIALENAN